MKRFEMLSYDTTYPMNGEMFECEDGDYVLYDEVEKMKFTAREMELLSGMVDVHQSHADRCDRIPSRMASKQKGYDLERVALLKRIIKAGELWQ